MLTRQGDDYGSAYQRQGEADEIMTWIKDA